MTDQSSDQTTQERSALALARLAARVADDKKATDTVVLHVGGVLDITDYFVITSASNRRQVRTIAESVAEVLRDEGDRRPLRTEGLGQQDWVLLDYGDVVVHVFADETRRFYEIERLYRDAPRIEWEPSPRPDLSSPEAD
ncbi:MAG: ribosome silencing factor [Ilumatobacteraceae bacterium]